MDITSVHLGAMTVAVVTPKLPDEAERLSKSDSRLTAILPTSS